MDEKLQLLDLLKPKVYPEREEGMMNFPLSELAIFSEEEKKLLQNFGFRSLSDLAIQWSKVLEIENYFPLKTEKFYLVTTIARLLFPSASNHLGTNEETEELQCKIVFAGLNQSGKTSIIRYLSRLVSEDRYSEHLRTVPTVRSVSRVASVLGLPFALWELGGQETYRQEYLREPERFFLRTSLLIFVFDVSANVITHTLALEYLSQILEVFSFLGINPKYQIFLHKSDLEYNESTRERLEDKIDEIFLTHSLDPPNKHLSNVFDIHLRTLFSKILLDFLQTSVIKEMLDEVKDVLGAEMVFCFSLPFFILLGQTTESEKTKNDWLREVYKRTVRKELLEQENYSFMEEFKLPIRSFLLVSKINVGQTDFVVALLFRKGTEAFALDVKQLQTLFQHKMTEILPLVEFSQSAILNDNRRSSQ